MSTLETSSAAKVSRLKEDLARMGKVAVAFSGGVDSTYLASVAKEVLGDDAVAVMASSSLVPASEEQNAEWTAEDIGIRLLKVDADPLVLEEVRGNAPDRCYHCKRSLFALIGGAAEKEGARMLVDGTNADDAKAYRPGAKALREMGVRSPLLDAGLTKEEVREAAREAGIPGWDRPSCSCLATRVAYGQPLDPEVLTRIDKAEDFIRSLDFAQCRVRVHGDVARIEVAPGQVGRIAEPAMRREVIDFLHGLGFVYVTLDLDGFRSGSMDASLVALEGE